MYVVYINLLYFLSIFLFTYNKNLLPPPPKKLHNRHHYMRVCDKPPRRLV